MMLRYTVELVSDAEMGTGLGSVLVDDYIPRNSRGAPCIPATHLRGLLRERLRDLGKRVGFEGSLDDEILGREGANAEDEGLVRLSGADADGETNVHVVSRTALNADGTVQGTRSLRSTQAVAAATIFRGVLHLQPEATDFARDCLLLGLRTITALGGGRTRGSGTCILEIEGEQRTLTETLTSIREHKDRAVRRELTEPVDVASDSDLVYLRLTFHAESPICCPETPVLSSINVIKSGPVIPASAVQGALLWRINAVAPRTADRCFADPRFRAWPLHPACDEAQASIRTPMSLRISNRVTAGDLAPADMLDAALDRRVDPGNSAVKYTSADGFLMPANGRCTLLRVKDLKRVLTAHKVAQSSDGGEVDNVYSVEALAPTVFRGLLVVPADAAEILRQSLERDGTVFFGKSRSVRGSGSLVVTPITGPVPLEFVSPDADFTVLVAQSPVILPEAADATESLESSALRLATEWCGTHQLPQPDRVWVSAAVRFGWSRQGTAGRTAARRVLQPGSTIRLKGRVDQNRLSEALVAGIGAGREEGYGALAVHPGLPSRLHAEVADLQLVTSPHAEIMPSIEKLARTAGPSKSQIAAFQVQLARGKRHACDFLDHQLKRGTRIQRVWKPVREQLSTLIGRNEDAAVLAEALTTWVDIIAAKEDAS